MELRKKSSGNKLKIFLSEGEEGVDPLNIPLDAPLALTIFNDFLISRLIK